jgi:hypothetical protein
MGAAAALREGLRRTARAPALVAGTFLVTLLVALPLTIALRGMLAAQVDASLVATMQRVDRGWWQEYLSQASGLGQTFVPSIIGFGAVLKNLSDLLDNLPLAATVAGAVAAWMVVWSFLSGGIIDRLARDRPTRSVGFFGAAGAHFPALARLGIVALIVYGVVFRWLHPLLLDDAYVWLTRDVRLGRWRRQPDHRLRSHTDRGGRSSQCAWCNRGERPFRTATRGRGPRAVRAERVPLHRRRHGVWRGRNQRAAWGRGGVRARRG